MQLCLTAPPTAPDPVLSHSSHARFSPNGKYILASTLNSTIRLWDYGQAVNKGAFVRQFTGHTNKQFRLFSDFLVSGPSAKVVSGSEDKTLCVWDLQSKNLLQVLKGHSTVPISVSCHPSAAIIATSSLEPENSIVLWADESIGSLPEIATQARAAFASQEAESQGAVSQQDASAPAAPAVAPTGGVKRPRSDEGGEE